MLPPFEIRGLHWPTEDPPPKIQLEEEEQYDELIHEHPETTLSYTDDDDGELITVSAMERCSTRNPTPPSPAMRSTAIVG